MDGKLDASEIADAIINMSGGKAAGPDGLPVDIYKIFKDIQRQTKTTMKTNYLNLS